MKALTLHHTNMASGDHPLLQPPQALCGRSLTSNYAPPSLENRFLSQSSTMKPLSCSPILNLAASTSACPALQPSRLSSTKSSLLSSTSFTCPSSSHLISTENKLLTSDALKSSLTITSVSGHALFSQTTILEPRELRKADGKKEEERLVTQSCSDQTSTRSSESDQFSEEESAMEQTDSVESSTAPTDWDIQDVDETMAVTEEGFPELERENDIPEEELKEKKYYLLNAVCCSLVNKSKAPGQKGWQSKKNGWSRIQKLAVDISERDPEFLLKVAVYTRQKLNIRITANFLLALAADMNTTKPHLRRYFCAVVQLPSDWLEVIRIYTACFKRSLPMCLKKAMADKFKEFSEYQLAKYNTRKHRCKHNSKTPKKKEPSNQQLKKWAALVRSEATMLKKFLRDGGKKTVSVVDKKESEFSIKKMIKRFHIKEPAESIMALLGKKYPADYKSFTRSGLKGEWDRERAGQRMKLKEPQTWERLLSQGGNKAATWEKLIDEKSLPFMAMLRNLRNMIIKGISLKHHNKILKRLTNRKAVMESRQFPFRFLAAYKVIMELRALVSEAQVAIPSTQETLKGILAKIPQSNRFKSQQWETTSKSRIKVALGVPFVYRMYKIKRNQLQKANQRLYTMDLLDRYCKALETAVQISCRYNVPPLPGRTVIVLSPQNFSYNKEAEKHDFCLPPPDPESANKDEEAEENQRRRYTRKKKSRESDALTPTIQEVGALLALMIHSSAEDCQICLATCNHWEGAKLKSNVLLDNVRTVVKQMEACHNLDYDKRDTNYFYRTFTKRNTVNNIILLDNTYINSNVLWAIKYYRNEINNKALVVQIDLSDKGYNTDIFSDPNYVSLNGFSEQMLRFVAERGSSRLLDHVEHMDKLFNVPPPKSEKEAERTSSVSAIPASPNLRWRGVRVFISSTFRDMHSERDVLVQSVFPELRRRAAQHCLYLQEVELRWGVTEEESERATELCLSEVCRSDMLVGILGERYGLVPPKPVLPDLPQYRWLDSAPAGLSITEMELGQFQALHPDVAHQRMFCYFRDPNIINSIPAAWRSDFSPESKEAQEKMSALKERLIDSGVKVTENYPCAWGGIADGKPHLKNLEEFSNAVLEDLWLAVKKLFVDEAENFEAATEVHEQEAHQETLTRQFFGRSKLLSAAVDKVECSQDKGWITVVEGGSGEGKTVFMAALAEALKTGVKSKRNLVCSVLSYSTAASQSARSLQNLLRCLVLWLRNMNGTEKQTPLPSSYKELLEEFHSTLNDEKSRKPLVVLVDGVELVQDGRGQLSCDWIPQQLPRGVCLVVSASSKAALVQTLVKRGNSMLVSLGQLTTPERKDIIVNKLGAFGKKLSDSAFNNQLQTLMMKKGAASPFYLHLACEDLRNFASFEKLKGSVQDLPQSLSQLVQYSLERLCWRYRDMPGLRWALAVLTVSPSGLKERDFNSVLNTCNTLSSNSEPNSWENVLQLSRKPKGRVPMATFTRVVQSLQSLIGSSHCYNTDDLLTLTHPEVKQAFENFLLPEERDRKKAHLVLAAHLWTRADPQGQETFLHCEMNSVMHLPHSLECIEQRGALKILLSSFYFLYANVRHGLLQHLLETYKLVDCLDNPMEQCHDFLQRHAVVLSSWPGLFIQEALVEPPVSPAHAWAKSLVRKGPTRLVERQNHNCWDTQEISDLMSVFQSEPTCLALSPEERLLVVGDGKGMLHIIDPHTGQEIKSLVSSCDGISSCVFVTHDRLVATSFDGRVEVWDIENGCRTALYNAHTNAITASNITADKKHIATVSLDFNLKVWSSTKGQEVASHLSASPLNCVTFDPDGHLLAAGCWNGNVILWNWLQNKTLPLLCGHQRSVRSLSFSSSSMLCSGSVSGEVRVWSVPTSTCVGCFQAHSGATESLAFLGKENMLLTAGSDHTLQLWSGGLGRSVATLKSDKTEQEPPQKKPKSSQPEPAALCVAVNGDCVAVGYHGDSIKIFNIESGELIQSIEYVQLSILCLLWVDLDAGQSRREVLVASGSDKRLRGFKRIKGDEGRIGKLESVGMFFGQFGVVLAMAQNSTYLATASEDCTIVLWLLKNMTVDVSMDPHDLLKGHTGAVTCLAFSPDGSQLLSGGKDQALMLWDVCSSPAVLFKSLPHAHRDWVTDCVWTSSCVLSSSNDGRLCVWDLEAGRCLREISWRSPPSSFCCLGQHVVAGCADGGIRVWNWETNVEMGHNAAHEQRVHHCTLLPHKDVKREEIVDELTVITASDDGTVKVWKPLQMEHFVTFQGHSGAIQGLVLKEKRGEFLTVSDDRSLRCWTWMKDYPPNTKGHVAALCFSEDDETFAAAYESGLMEVWRKNAVIGHKQVADSPITSICSVGNEQFAVGYLKKPLVDVWKLVWNEQRTKRSLVMVTSYETERPVVHLFHSSALLGVSCFGDIFDVSCKNKNYQWMHEANSWSNRVRILNVTKNDKKSAWLVGEEDGEVRLGFIFTMGPNSKFYQAFGSLNIEYEEEEENEAEDEEEEEKGNEEEEAKSENAETEQDEDEEEEDEKEMDVEEEEEQEKLEGEEDKGEEEEEEEKEDEEDDEEEKKKANKGSLITALTVDQELVVCGDIEGNMWFNLPQKLTSWSPRKPAHTDRITQLRLTDTTIISASCDRTVKLWDRSTKKQLGMFVCGGHVLVLEVNPRNPTELLCGDADGMVYVLNWRE